MKRALKNLPAKQKKVWVNCGNTHAKRRDAWLRLSGATRGGGATSSHAKSAKTGA